MKAAHGICHFLLAAFLHCLFSKPSHSQVEENHRAGEVIKWMEVYNRSYCQLKEQLVEISTEYPEEVEHIFLPSCVPLLRCAGCCVDEELHCIPTKMHIVVMQIMKTKFMNTQIVEMPFVQHSECECRPKKNSKLKAARRERLGGKSENRPKRKRKKGKTSITSLLPCSECPDRRQQQNPQTCECTCKRSVQRCRAKGLELNEHTCRCEKLRR
ncbi:vascular endothelial growth factor B isoform X1 [Microcaecilia unicolor]|uniref:Vascular endothelial growth factor B isoform X1 n=1 Tax=Microcaecilia unicolor TaxID=1415580 RepID=A0A6P7ZC08_9AMPH|nr:vascular endothelial growth factor B isoform X1 [Microcaecilia unicolor]